MISAVVVTTSVVGGGNGAHGPSERSPQADLEDYKIVYRVESYAGGDLKLTWEARVVRRPFDGMILGYAERPVAGSKPLSGTLSTATGIFMVDETGRTTQVAGRGHRAGVGDLRLLEVLDDLLRDGVLVDRHRAETVAGRQCHVYRTLEPPSLSLQQPTRSDYDELCIDDAGLVLRERWYTADELAMVREAVSVDERPDDTELRSFDAAEATSSSPPSPRALRGPVEVFLAAPPTPMGFHLVGRFEYVPDIQASLAGGGVYRSVSWVFADGGDFVVVEAGKGPAPFSFAEGSPVEELAVGTGRVLAAAEGAEARVDVGDTRWLRVRATASEAWLEDYLPSLRLAG